MTAEAANYLIDSGGKVVVSLGGGRCPLNCAHCYIFAPEFRFFPTREPTEGGDELIKLGPQVTAVYLSGDIEPFLDQDKAISFLSLAADRLDVDLLFTTRLILGENTLEQLNVIAALQAAKGKLLIGCVSIAAWDSYRSIERSRLVGTPLQRVEQLARFHALRIPTMLAARPVFPPELVPLAEYRRMFEAAAPYSTVVLGETLFLDTDGVLERRLGISLEKDYDIATMTFFDQPREWKICKLDAQVAGMREICVELNKPFYMRSMPGVELIRQYWNGHTGELSCNPAYPLPVSDLASDH